jgi:hypothetical protein
VRQNTEVVDWFAHEILSPTGTVIGFTVATYKEALGTGITPLTARRARCTVETQSIRYWEDGTDPTTSEGHLVASGGSFIVEGSDAIRKFRVIAVTGSPKIHVSFGR